MIPALPGKPMTIGAAWIERFSITRKVLNPLGLYNQHGKNWYATRTSSLANYTSKRWLDEMHMHVIQFERNSTQKRDVFKIRQA